MRHFNLEANPADLSVWQQIETAIANLEQEITIAMVGKYVDLTDAYKSLNEALYHAGIRSGNKVNIRYVDSEDLAQQGTGLLADVDGIIVPGGFGNRGIEGKILAVQYARENRIPLPRHLPGDANCRRRIRAARPRPCRCGQHRMG